MGKTVYSDQFYNCPVFVSSVALINPGLSPHCTVVEPHAAVHAPGRVLKGFCQST